MSILPTMRMLRLLCTLLFAITALTLHAAPAKAPRTTLGPFAIATFHL